MVKEQLGINPNTTHTTHTHNKVMRYVCMLFIVHYTPNMLPEFADAPPPSLHGACLTSRLSDQTEDTPEEEELQCMGPYPSTRGVEGVGFGGQHVSGVRISSHVIPLSSVQRRRLCEFAKTVLRPAFMEFMEDPPAPEWKYTADQEEYIASLGDSSRAHIQMERDVFDKIVDQDIRVTIQDIFAES